MRAIVHDPTDGSQPLRLAEVEAPELRPRSVRIQVQATALNRADLLQRRGLYSPPPGTSPILGLECSGLIRELGHGVEGWREGDRVMALLPGGGYAEEVVVDAGSCLRIPDSLDLAEAGALPEVLLTVFLNVFGLAQLAEGDWLLVHGGGSGIGTAAIQMARAAGAHVIVTAGSEAKCRGCLELGARVAINYREQDFALGVSEATEGQGVSVILDSIGADYLEQNLASLSVGGRLVLIGLMGGAQAEISLATLLGKRLQLIGSTLRARSEAEKSLIVSGFEERFGRALQQGSIRPVIDRKLPLAQAEEAHRIMQASEHFGKLLLEVR